MSQRVRSGASALRETVGPDRAVRPAGGTGARDDAVRILAVLFVIRGLLSAADALSLSAVGLRSLPLIGPMAFSAASPLWSVLWAVLAGGAGLLILRRWGAGWLVGSAVAIAYLVSGVSDLSLLDWSSAAISFERAFVVVVDLLVPASVLGLLSLTVPAQLRQGRVRRRSVAARDARGGERGS